MSQMRGYLCALFAAIMYGLMYTPVKAYPVYDGTKFQWFMSAGIGFTGIVAAIAGGPYVAASGEFISVIPHGIVGGCLWSISNMCVLPTVKFLGLGVGFAMYHSINMVVGYSIGRYGLLGAPKDAIPPTYPRLCDLGLWLLVASLFAMIAVEPEISEVSEGDDVEQAAPRKSVKVVEFEKIPESKIVEIPLYVPKTAARQMEMESLRAVASAPAKEPRRALSVGRLDELTLAGGDKKTRAGYGSWRQGKSKGHSESSTGATGVLAPLTRNRVERRLARDSTLWPFFAAGERTGVQSRYRGMISDVDERPRRSARVASERARLLGGEEPSETAAERFAAAAEQRERKKRFAVGGTFGVLAGLLAGVNMLPYTIYLAERRAITGSAELTAAETISYFFSQCMGISLSATLTLAFATVTAKCVDVELKMPALWPGWAGGMIWACGFFVSEIAVADLGMTAAYTYDAIGPVMLSAVISFACGEIDGRLNTALFLLSLLLQTGGVLCIALGA